MTSLWSTATAASRFCPDALHDSLGKRLANLEALLPRLSVRDAEVSQRDLIGARSRTALSCKLDARLMAAEEDPTPPSRPFIEECDV